MRDVIEIVAATALLFAVSYGLFLFQCAVFGACEF